MANEGGWKPVFRRSQGRKGPVARLHTIFVDEIPESMTPKGMYTMFSNFGIVKDVYIPEKMRKATKTRFGFVRYDCSIAVGIAIQKANEVWCGDRILKVKRADFERGKEPKYPRAIIQKPVGIPSSARADVGGRSSYAEVLKGGMNGGGYNIRIKAEEYATDWLQMSVVTKIKTHCSFTDLKAECQHRGLKDIQLREGGGRNVFITFKSKEDLMHFIHSSGDWIMEWCESIIEWHKGVSLDNERVVWASCFGVPPHLWNVNNFRKIGEACGVVVEMDHNVLSMESLKCGKVRICTTQLERIDKTVLLERDGSTYLVRVVEVVDLPLKSMGGGDLSSATNHASRKEDDDVDKPVAGGAKNRVIEDSKRNDVTVGAGSERVCYSASLSMVNETSIEMGTRNTVVVNSLPNESM